MAVAWSKTVPNTCYEVGHCWEPSCWKALVPLAWESFKYSVKIYGTLYLLAALLRRKKKQYYWKRLVPETLRSAVFLATNGSLLLGTFCLWRHLLGRMTFPSSGFLPGVCSSFLAIILERKSRRGMLALYLLNLAVETAFRMATSRNMLPSIRHGEVLLFSSTLAIYVYFYKKNALPDNVKRLLGYLVGRSELPPRGDDSSLTGPGPTQQSVDVSTSAGDSTGQQTVSTPGVGTGRRSSGLVSYFPKNLKFLVHLWRRGPKHGLCRHTLSCHANAIESGVRMFVFGYLVQAAMKLIRALTAVFRKPSGVLAALKHKDNVRLGLFLGCFASLLRTCHCLLRWLRNRDSEIHGLVSGFVAGLSMLWYKSSSIAMWTTSKLAEIMYFKGIEEGVVPYLKNGDVLVYTFATAFVLHAAVFEPHNMRPAYWNFLQNLTNQRFGMMNRKLLDTFGTNASKMFPDYWPKYDKRYTNL